MFKANRQTCVRHQPYETAGFTLVELVVVLVLVGIMAAYIVPRLTLRSGFDERTLQEELVSTARYAQQLAMMRGPANGVAFIVGTNNYSIQVNGVPITHPNGQPFPINYPNGISVTIPAPPITMTYTALGDVILPPAPVNIIGTGLIEFCIEATGYAHTC